MTSYSNGELGLGQGGQAGVFGKQRSAGFQNGTGKRNSMQEPRALEIAKGGVLYHGANKRFYRYYDEKVTADGHGNGHDHGHHERAPSILTAAASAVINYLLMFGLCCAYGMIMFTDDWNAKHRGLGVKLNLGTVMLMGGLLAWQSKVPVAMGGPDLNPVVFLGTFVGILSEDIANQLSLDYPDTRKRRLQEEACTYNVYDCGAWLLSSYVRFLGSEDEDEFCTGSHLEAYPAECQDYHEQVRATTIFATSCSTLLLACQYFMLGTFQKTKFVNYVPSNIMEAFLACVGFKVFKYALKFCKYDAKQFMPAAMIGVPLYFFKAKHIGNPAVVLPSMLLIPLALFYIVLFASGSDLEEARKDKIMFPKIEDVPFWNIWTDSIGKYDKVNFKAFAGCMVDLVIMLIVCTIDNLLKLSSTEVKLPVKVDKDYEIQLHGKGNILTALCGCSVGYMQLKFNVINYGVMGNCTDRRGGLFTAILCGACFFGTIEHFNFLPRAFLSALLFFAGSGFVAENLWGSRLYLGFDEWVQVVSVLAVFIIFGSLLYAVIAGGLMIGVSFLIRYSKVPCTVGPPLYGGELLSCERRFQPLQVTIRHIARQWVVIVRLKGFVFFASATNLVRYLQEEVKIHSDQEEEYKRLRFFVFDCEALDAMDSSAAKAFRKFSKDCKEIRIRMLWSGVDKPHEAQMRRTKLLEPEEKVFADLDEAVLYVEDMILEYRNEIQLKWKEMSFAYGLGQLMACTHMQYDPFDAVLDSMDAQFGGRWDFCQTVSVKAFQSVLWNPGEEQRELYLVHSGAVALFDELRERAPDDRHHHEGTILPVAVYRHGWFLNREALMRVPTRFHAVAIEDAQLIAWTRNSLARMEREQPWMASRIMEEAMNQAQADVERTVEDLIHSQEAEEPEVELLHHFGGSVSHGFGHHDHHADPTASSRRSTMRRRSRHGCDSHGIEGSETSAKYRKKQQVNKELLGYSLQTLQPGKAAPDLMKRGSTLELDIPEPTGLFSALEATNAALFLEHHGLYEDPEESGILPPLPEHIQMSLKQAFETYQVKGSDGPVVPWESISDALNMAGLFHVLLVNITRGPLTLGEFMELGHEAALARLSQTQIDAIVSLYKELDADRDGFLTIEEAIRLITKLFTKKRITFEDAQNLAAPWANKYGGLDKETFVVFISRYVKKYSTHWLLLDATREIFGLPRAFVDGSALPSTVPGERLFAPEVLAKLKMSEEELAEVLWASGCCGEEAPQDMDEIDLASVVQAAQLYAGKVYSPLPPPPPRSLAEIKVQDRYASKWLEKFDGMAVSNGGQRKVIRGKRLKRISGRTSKCEKKVDPRSFGSAFCTDFAPDKAIQQVSSDPVKESMRQVGPNSPAETKTVDDNTETSTDLPVDIHTDLPELSDLDVKQTLMPVAPVRDSLRRLVIDIRSLSKKAPRPAGSEDVTLRCPRGHYLESTKSSQTASGKKVFQCSRCGRKSNASVQEVFCCHECGYHVCDTCVKKSNGTGKAHMLDNLLLRDISGVGFFSNKPRMTEIFPLPILEEKPDSKHPSDLVDPDNPFKGNTCRENVYIVLFKPDLTSPGRVISNFMGLMIILNLVVMIFKPLFCTPGEACWEDPVWFYIEAGFCGLFTIEFVVRISVCNAFTNSTADLLAFTKNPSNLCDLLSVLPFYFSLVADQKGAGSWALILKVVRLFRLARIMRVMRLTKTMPAKYSQIIPPVMVIFLVIWGIYSKEAEFEKGDKK